MNATQAIWVALIGTLFSCVLSSLFHALTAVSRSSLREAGAKKNDPRVSARVERIVEDLDGHARAMGLPRLMCNFAVVVSCAMAVGWLRRDDQVVHAVDILIGAGCATLLLWVFGVVVPLSVGSHAAERLVVGASRVVRAIYLVQSPLLPLVRTVDRLVHRLAGAPVRDDASKLEAEILSVIDEGEREGAIDGSERDMIEGVVELRSTTVDQIMTPRMEIAALRATDDFSQVVEFVRRVGHSRIPVYERDLDHVLGFLYAKDLIGWTGRGGEFRIRNVLRPALFVPETKTVRELLAELTQRKVHIAIVADEFGGTAGVVTIEDIVEEIFGDIQDEYERAADAPPRISVDTGTGRAEIDARAYIDDVNDALEDLGVQLPEGDDYDTLGGFVTTTLGRFPDRGEEFAHGAAVIRVLDATPRRVIKVEIEVRPKDAKDAVTDAADNGVEHHRNEAGEASDARQDRAPLA